MVCGDRAISSLSLFPVPFNAIGIIFKIENVGETRSFQYPHGHGEAPAVFTFEDIPVLALKT